MSDADLTSMLTAAKLANAKKQADERRNLFADQLERLATDIRVEHYSPNDIIVVLMEPNCPTLGRVGQLTWHSLDAARAALHDASLGRYHADHNVIQAMQDGAVRRRATEARQEQTIAAKHVEYPYLCSHCGERFRTVRGRDQHIASQLRLGCIACGVHRCSNRGGSYDYSDHYRGKYTCTDCLRAAEQ